MNQDHPLVKIIRESADSLENMAYSQPYSPQAKVDLAKRMREQLKAAFEGGVFHPKNKKIPIKEHLEEVLQSAAKAQYICSGCKKPFENSTTAANLIFDGEFFHKPCHKEKVCK